MSQLKDENIHRLNHAQKAGRFVQSSSINGVKVRIVQNEALLTKIKMIRNCDTRNN